MLLSTNYELTTTTERVIDQVNFDSESSKIDVEECQLGTYNNYYFRTFFGKIYTEKREDTFENRRYRKPLHSPPKLKKSYY